MDGMLAHLSEIGMKHSRHADLLRDAERVRLVRMATVSHRGRRERALAGLGERLITLGEGLKARYAPATA